MARIKLGILGPINGSVGNIVARSWNGKNYVQSKPSHYNDAKTETQVKNRTRFIACTRLGASALDETLIPIWRKNDHDLTWLQMFIRININAFDETCKIASYEMLQFSIGDLPLPDDISIHEITGSNNEFQISWTDNSGFDIEASTDRLMVMSIYGEEVSLLNDLTATRADQITNISLPCESGSVVHLYLFFINKAKSRGSANYYQMIQLP